MSTEKIENFIDETFPPEIKKDLNIQLEKIFCILNMALLHYETLESSKRTSKSNFTVVDLLDTILSYIHAISLRNYGFLLMASEYFSKSFLINTCHTCFAISLKTPEIQIKINNQGVDPHPCSCNLLQNLLRVWDRGLRTNLKIGDFLINFLKSQKFKEMLSFSFMSLYKKIIENDCEQIQNITIQVFGIPEISKRIIESNDLIKCFIEGTYELAELHSAQKVELDKFSKIIILFHFDLMKIVVPSTIEALSNNTYILKKILDFMCLIQNENKVFITDSFITDTYEENYVVIEGYLLKMFSTLATIFDFNHKKKADEVLFYILDLLLINKTKYKNLDYDEFSFHIPLQRAFSIFFNRYCLSNFFKFKINISIAAISLISNYYKSRKNLLVNNYCETDLVFEILDPTIKCVGWINSIQAKYWTYFGENMYYYSQIYYSIKVHEIFYLADFSLIKILLSLEFGSENNIPEYLLSNLDVMDSSLYLYPNTKSNINSSNNYNNSSNNLNSKDNEYPDIELKGDNYLYLNIYTLIHLLRNDTYLLDLAFYSNDTLLKNKICDELLLKLFHYEQNKRKNNYLEILKTRLLHIIVSKENIITNNLTNSEIIKSLPGWIETHLKEEANFILKEICTQTILNNRTFTYRLKKEYYKVIDFFFYIDPKKRKNVENFVVLNRSSELSLINTPYINSNFFNRNTEFNFTLNMFATDILNNLTSVLKTYLLKKNNINIVNGCLKIIDISCNFYNLESESYIQKLNFHKNKKSKLKLFQSFKNRFKKEFYQSVIEFYNHLEIKNSKLNETIIYLINKIKKITNNSNIIESCLDLDLTREDSKNLAPVRLSHVNTTNISGSVNDKSVYNTTYSTCLPIGDNSNRIFSTDSGLKQSSKPSQGAIMLKKTINISTYDFKKKSKSISGEKDKVERFSNQYKIKNSMGLKVNPSNLPPTTYTTSNTYNTYNTYNSSNANTTISFSNLKCKINEEKCLYCDEVLDLKSFFTNPIGSLAYAATSSTIFRNKLKILKNQCELFSQKEDINRLSSQRSNLSNLSDVDSRVSKDFDSDCKVNETQESKNITTSIMDDFLKNNDNREMRFISCSHKIHYKCYEELILKNSSINKFTTNNIQIYCSECGLKSNILLPVIDPKCVEAFEYKHSQEKEDNNTKDDKDINQDTKDTKRDKQIIVDTYENKDQDAEIFNYLVNGTTFEDYFFFFKNIVKKSDSTKSDLNLNIFIESDYSINNYMNTSPNKSIDLSIEVHKLNNNTQNNNHKQLIMNNLLITNYIRNIINTKLETNLTFKEFIAEDFHKYISVFTDIFMDWVDSIDILNFKEFMIKKEGIRSFILTLRVLIKANLIDGNVLFSLFIENILYWNTDIISVKNICSTIETSKVNSLIINTIFFTLVLFNRSEIIYFSILFRHFLPLLLIQCFIRKCFEYRKTFSFSKKELNTLFTLENFENFIACEEKEIKSFLIYYLRRFICSGFLFYDVNDKTIKEMNDFMNNKEDIDKEFDYYMYMLELPKKIKDIINISNIYPKFWEYKIYPEMLAKSLLDEYKKGKNNELSKEEFDDEDDLKEDLFYLPSSLLLVNINTKFSLIELPKTLLGITTEYHCKCLNCKTFPLYSVICLLCGEMLCYMNDCCNNIKVGNKTYSYEYQYHANECGQGTSCFMLTHNGGIIYGIKDQFFSILDSPYINNYGECLNNRSITSEYILNSEKMIKIKEDFTSLNYIMFLGSKYRKLDVFS